MSLALSDAEGVMLKSDRLLKTDLLSRTQQPLGTQVY